jgi:hypothetical protein
MGVYQVCSNKRPWVKIGPVGGLYRGERHQGHHGPLVLISADGYFLPNSTQFYQITNKHNGDLRSHKNGP